MCWRMWYWGWWYNVWWYNILRSTSSEPGYDGWYNMWRSNIWWSKSRCVWECVIGIDEIMFDDIIFEDQQLASMAGIDDITCDDLVYDDLNPDVWEKVVLELMI